MGDIRQYLDDIRNGRRASNELYSETRQTLLPTLKRWIPKDLQSRWDAEDLLHEAFLRAMENLGSFEWRGNGSWRNFILTIARHCIQDAMKRKSRMDVRFTRGSSVGGLRSSEVVDPRQAHAELITDRDSVEAVLDRMSRSDARLIRLKVLESLSDEHVADKIGKSPETTRKAIHRAMVKFTEIGQRLWGRKTPPGPGASGTD